jgi:hypothetical protein
MGPYVTAICRGREQWTLDLFFTGSPTDKAIWMLVVGIVAIIIGLAGLLRGQHKGA